MVRSRRRVSDRRFESSTVGARSPMTCARHCLVQRALHGRSLSLSRCAVASSSTTVARLEQEARQRDTLLFAAAQPITRSPTTVSRPSGSDCTNSQICAAAEPIRSPPGSPRSRENQIRPQRVVKEVRSCVTTRPWRSVTPSSLAYVDTVYRDRPVVNVIETRHQHRNRRLARTAVTDQRGHRAGSTRNETSWSTSVRGVSSSRATAPTRHETLRRRIGKIDVIEDQLRRSVGITTASDSP